MQPLRVLGPNVQWRPRPALPPRPCPGSWAPEVPPAPDQPGGLAPLPHQAETVPRGVQQSEARRVSPARAARGSWVCRRQRVRWTSSGEGPEVCRPPAVGGQSTCADAQQLPGVPPTSTPPTTGLRSASWQPPPALGQDWSEGKKGWKSALSTPDAVLGTPAWFRAVAAVWGGQLAVRVMARQSPLEQNSPPPLGQKSTSEPARSRPARTPEALHAPAARPWRPVGPAAAPRLNTRMAAGPQWAARVPEAKGCAAADLAHCSVRVRRSQAHEAGQL